VAALAVAMAAGGLAEVMGAIFADPPHGPAGVVPQGPWTRSTGRLR
jgi:hypothetical protein